jgi:hypothetical protein
MNMSFKIISVALIASVPWLGSPASALPISASFGMHNATTSTVEAVRYRGRGLVGAGIGLAAGAIIGGAILGGAILGAGPYYGNPAYGYGYDGYGPAYAAPGYAYAPGYRQGYATGGGDPAYCAQRYRSYDPASGTYLGFDGLRHPC